MDAFPQFPPLRQAQPEITHPRGHRGAGLSSAIVLIIPRSPHLAAAEAPPVDAQVRLTLQKHVYRAEIFGTDGRGHITLLIRTILVSANNCSSWKAVRDRASPAMPKSLRGELEARVLAGDRIGGPQIRRARLAPGAKRDQLALLIAA